MRYMNDYDIEMALRRYSRGNTPNRHAAAQTILNLADWTNHNSDGWAYWPKPARAAARLMELLESDGTWEAQRRLEETDATDREFLDALRPVKSFLTRQGVTHSEVIVDPAWFEEVR